MDQGFYSQNEIDTLPELAVNLSRGCGNPTGYANLQNGEIVVDFGCGGGIDIILASHKVGIEGKIVGVDHSTKMIEKAKETVHKAELQDRDIDFKIADLSYSQLTSGFADVVISNCVINLCPDKKDVYGEMFRILKPNGRISISDIVLKENINSELQNRFQSTWSGCLGGAIEETDYLQIVKNAGFSNIQVLISHILSPDELESMACCPGEEFTPVPLKNDLSFVNGKIASIKFTATKS